MNIKLYYYSKLTTNNDMPFHHHELNDLNISIKLNTYTTSVLLYNMSYITSVFRSKASTGNKLVKHKTLTFANV